MVQQDVQASFGLSIEQYYKAQNYFCSPIPTITHLYYGAVILDFPLVIAFSQGSNIYRRLLEKSTFIPFKLH